MKKKTSLSKSLDQAKRGYETKIAHQRDTIKDLREQIELYRSGLNEVNAAVDAILAAMAVEYGRRVDDQDGTLMGYNITVSDAEITRALDLYHVHAEKQTLDGKTVYLIGAVRKATAPLTTPPPTGERSVTAK